MMQCKRTLVHLDDAERIVATKIWQCDKSGLTLRETLPYDMVSNIDKPESLPDAGFKSLVIGTLYSLMVGVILTSIFTILMY